MKKLGISVLFSLLIIPLSFFVVNIFWNIGLFSFGTGLNEMPFSEITNVVFSHIFDLSSFGVLFFYYYFAWYTRIKDNGLQIVGKIVKREGFMLLLCYLAIIIVCILGLLFSDISEFAAMFVPIGIIILSPFTAFTLTMLWDRNKNWHKV